MLNLSTFHVTIICLSSTLAFTNIACSSDKSRLDADNNEPLISTTIAPSAVPTPLESSAPPGSLSEEVAANLAQPNNYELALDKAVAAATISQSAQSLDDWQMVMLQWQEAIALMKAVPKNSPYKALAQLKITEYKQNLNSAKKQASYTVKKEPDRVVVVVPQKSRESFSTSRSDAIETPSNQQVFQAKIKRRAGGTPVINVTFNGDQQFEMIVDTGASGTVITQQTAAALGVVPVAKGKANTASDRAVEFDIGYVDSIEVGGAKIKKVPIAIAPSPELETGLLGHDFFGEYDVTIKRDVVEFRPR